MLSRFERFVEHAVEGSLRRVLPAHLQPVQVAKAAARAMEEAQVVGLHGAEVPNAYRVRLHPDDLARFADYRATLAGEVARYLAEYAADRGLWPVGSPRVEIVADPGVVAGTARADARFVDLEPARQAALEDALDGTRRLRLDQAAAAGPPSAAAGGALSLRDALGTDFALDPATGLVRIGRAVDNDLVIPNQRVSRYHAQVQWSPAGWLVRDLDSTNGTFLDGEPLAGRLRPLRPGAVLRLGDHDLRVLAGG